MRLPIQFATGRRPDGFHRPPQNRQRLAWLVLPLLLAGAPLPALDFSREFSSQNAEFTIYAPGTFREIAVCRTEKIFTDHRKLGFFRVKLLPLLVAQGVRLEFAGEKPDGHWTESFQAGWLPDIKHSAVEWRDVEVSLQRENAPHLRAVRARPAAGGTPVVCTLEKVTLEAGGTKWQTPQAELRNEDGRPRVVWADGAVVRHWDLFSGETVVTPKPNGEKK